MNYTLTTTRLLQVGDRTIRIELFQHNETGMFKILTYELVPSPADGAAAHPHSPRYWRTLAYNTGETENPVAAINQIRQKVVDAAIPDFLV